MGLLAGFGQSQPGVLAEIGLRGFTDTVPRELVVAIVEHGVDQTSRVAFAQSSAGASRSTGHACTASAAVRSRQ